MADVFNQQKRSNIMRQIRNKGNKSTEIKMINIFKINHITGWRRNYKIFGKPDFVFHREKIAIFLDGCFWHGHACRNTHPKQNEEYWRKKLKRNSHRDIEVTVHLENLGWIVIRIWECELLKKNAAILTKKLSPIIKDNPDNLKLIT